MEKERQKEIWKQNREKYKNKISAQKKERYNTPKGRAFCLINNYKSDDKQRGFEYSVNFDYQWLIDNIFTECIYCGENDWHELGCDRIDNSKPHTQDNVVPCCKKCNNERKNMDFEEFKKIKLGGSSTP